MVIPLNVHHWQWSNDTAEQLSGPRACEGQNTWSSCAQSLQTMQEHPSKRRTVMMLPTLMSSLAYGSLKVYSLAPAFRTASVARSSHPGSIMRLVSPSQTMALRDWPVRNALSLGKPRCPCKRARRSSQGLPHRQ